jgi:mRNA-degrading endonuclease RelE of RelBE toxin-antitoxin system
MSFEVTLHREVRKAIKNIPFKEFDIGRVEGHRGMFKIRFGVFRLTYEIDENNRRIKLLKLEPRSKAYKGL